MTTTTGRTKRSIVTTVVKGEPIAWERPIRLKNGNTITPRRVQDAKKDIGTLVKVSAQEQGVTLPFVGPVSMTLVFSLTAGWDAQRGIKDIDNLAKTVLDALNKDVGYHDDRQVVQLAVSLFRGSDDPYTLIVVEGEEPESAP